MATTRAQFFRHEMTAPEATVVDLAQVVGAVRPNASDDTRLHRLILDQLDSGVTIEDAAGDLVYANERAAHMLGYPSADAMVTAGREDAMARFEMFDADDRPLSIEHIVSRTAFAGRASEEVLVRFQRRGTPLERWSVFRAVPLLDEAGHVTQVINFFREVTDNRREEQHRRFLLKASDALNASLDYEQTLATVAKLAVPVLADWCRVDIVERNDPKRLVLCHDDPQKLRLVEEIDRKYPPDPEAATGVPNVLRTGRAELVREIPRQVLTAAAADDEHLRLLDELQLRSYICVPLSVRGRTIGALSFVMAESGRTYGDLDLDFAQALADRAALAIDNARLFREAERAREASEERFRLMVDCVKDYAIFMLTPTGHIATWNRGARQIKGYSAEEIIGQHFSRFYPEEDVRAGKCELELRVASETGRFEDEDWRIKKDGSRFWANVVITRVLDADGVLVGFTKVTRDLSERRKLEEERINRARLETELAEQKKLDELREQLLGVVGHDLRSPLSAITMANSLMMKRGALPESEMRAAALVARNADRMAKMVSQLLDFTRARLGGGIPVEPKPMQLAELCADMIAECEAANPQRTIVFHSDGATSGVWDRERLGQVVANLLGNAIQHGDPVQPVSLRVFDEGGAVRLEVHNANAGLAIPPDVLPTIFDPFRRAAAGRTVQGRSDSLGLGLYIVREIVRAHDGTIAVESNEDGTTFNVRIPRTPR